MRLSYEYQEGEYSAKQLEAYGKMARASTGAIKEAGDLAKRAGRAAIAAGGFGSRWQNALRSRTYPQFGYSLNSAAYIWHKIPFAEIFETGGTISGHPLLWLPLNSVPKDGRGHHLTPAQYTKGGRKLISINRPGRRPILAAVTRGRKGKKGGVVPMYVGIPQVREPAKFDVAAAVREVGSHIGDLYLKHFEE